MRKNNKTIKTQLLKELKRLKNKEGLLLAGFPRYPRVFGRDSLISSWQLLDIDSSIAEKTLIFLSHYQGKESNNDKEEEPGKILHETDLEKKISKSNFPFPYYGSVDSTPLFLILFSFYFKKAKEKKFLKKHLKNIILAVDWMINYGDKDKDLFLEYERKNPRGLFHQGWKDSFENHLKITPPVAIVEVQGYQYLALRETAKILSLFGKEKQARSLIERARRLKREFNKRFWMEDKRYYALALDGEKKQKKAITSNPGHLLFTGICDKDKEKLVAKRLFSSELWTPYGIRTHSIKEKDFNPLSYHLGSVWPHDNWIIAQGLKKQRYKNKYLKIKKALLKTYKELGYLPEFYGVSLKNKIIIKGLEFKPCRFQAWAIGALLNLLS